MTKYAGYRARTAVLDADSISWHVASAAEESKVLVTHKPSGRVKEFKNKTEFHGRSKKTDGGWLGERNEKRIEKGLEPFKRQEFEIEEVYVPSPVENALHTAKLRITALREYAKANWGCDKYVLIMGEGENHRHELLLPRKYKSNRENLHRPIHLDAVREYIKEYYNTKVVYGREADDYIAELASIGYQDYQFDGVFSYIQCIEDKDGRGYPSLTWNPRREDRKWVYRDAELFEGLGELTYSVKTKCKGYGFKWLMFQCFGDDTDGYDAFKHMGIRFGDKSRYDILKDCETEKECLETVLSSYHKHFGDRVKYTAWDGTEVDITYQEYLEMIFTCAYMLKSENDDTTFKSLCEEYGADYCTKSE